MNYNIIQSLISGSIMGLYISYKLDLSWYLGSTLIFLLPVLITIAFALSDYFKK
ncbi:MAG TPA: hypothetical protein VNF93_02410 [Buchnera sp. (in: enterobacteria)]|nr:hypothetical protein [Buchnera sp. (in: enterobacteria)]